MADTMIERVAKALAARVDPDEWRTWLPFARDAIAAMRVPTRAMVKTGDAYFDDTIGVADDIWPKMIDAALSGDG